MSNVEALLAWELAWLGTTESGENRNPFAKIAGHKNGYAWCGTFQVAAAKSTGLALPPGADTAYTPSMFAAFRKAGLVVETPQPGDWGFVFYESLNRIGHVFAVREVISDRRVVTAEGNSNQAASNSGGEVASLQRDYIVRGGSAWVYGFVRPAYDGSPVEMTNLPPSAFTSHITATVAAHLVTVEPLEVDGRLGRLTISRWQQVLGTPTDGVIDDIGSSLVKAVQVKLNAALHADLVVDGDLGAKTIRALQTYLGTQADGKISLPTSAMVKALQRRLNTGAF